MAATVPRYMGRVRSLRIINMPRKRVKRGIDAIDGQILAEDGKQLKAESGAYLRTEQ